MSATTITRRNLVAGAAATALAGVALSRSGRVALATEAEGVRTYAAVESSMKGDITVVTTIENGAITAVQVIDDVDTPTIREAAIADVPARIVAGQNIEVDATTGATMTSMAIKNGVADALEAAGLDAAAFSLGSDAVEKAAGEDEAFDFVVVGGGMAGMSCAINFARNNEGLKVLLLEKQAYCGGSTLVCGGGIWAMGSRTNDYIGQDCSADDYVSFMGGWSEPVQTNEELQRAIHDISGEVFDYMDEWGIPVKAGGWTLGNPEAQLPCLWSTAGQATDWETGNSGMAEWLEVRARLLGVEIRRNSRVTGLVTADGAVTGVEVEGPETTYTVSAPAVVLATGGFTRNTDLIEQYAPEYVDAFAFTGGGSTGDGLVMATELGAQVIGQGMMGLFGLNPSLGYYGAYGNTVWHTQVTVNAEGQTFGMEGAFYGRTLKLLLDQTGSCGYGICDATVDIPERMEETVEAGYASRYDTLEELAADQGIDAEALAATCAEAGVAQAPFYCVVKRPLFIGSIPGVKVSADCEVLGADDAPIPGLYAAGEVMFGNVFDNAYPCSGTGMGTSCYTGAIAARSATR